MAEETVTVVATASAPASAGSEIKSGYKTTEFWLTVLATMWGIVLSSGLIVKVDAPWVQLIGALITAIVPTGYSIGRGMAKQ